MKVENIKFKAKSTLDGAWVQGDLVHNENGTIGILRNCLYLSVVDPSTVCQYTGLADCECEEIWEGDVLLDTNSDSLYTVKFSDYGAFFIRKNGTVDDDMYLFELEDEDKCIALFKVVGNKFDKEK